MLKNKKNNKVVLDEKQVIAARVAELKAMNAGDLKDLVLKKGLEKGLKGEMVERVLALEAKEREALRVQAAKRNEVIVAKKKELESMSLPELKDLCEKKGLK